LFEAAALALRTFKQHDCESGLITKLEVEIRSAVMQDVRESVTTLPKKNGMPEFGSVKDFV
jgi:hypothetical protein